MKLWFEKSIMLSLLLIMILSCFGCSSSKATQSNKSSLNEEEAVDKAISDYIVDNNIGKYLKTDKQFEAHKIYGIEEKDGAINVYMYSLFEGFSIIDKGFKSMSGSSCPAFIKLEKKNNRYIVVEYTLPLDGEYYAKSIRKMFPSEYAEPAIRDTSQTLKLDEQINKKAKEWLKEQGKDLVIID